MHGGVVRDTADDQGNGQEVGVYPVGGDLQDRGQVIPVVIELVHESIGEVCPGGRAGVGLQQAVGVVAVVTSVGVSPHDRIGHISLGSQGVVPNYAFRGQDPAVDGGSVGHIPLGLDLIRGGTHLLGGCHHNHQANGQCRGDEYIHRLGWPRSFLNHYFLLNRYPISLSLEPEVDSSSLEPLETFFSKPGFKPASYQAARSPSP